MNPRPDLLDRIERSLVEARRRPMQDYRQPLISRYIDLLMALANPTPDVPRRRWWQ